jgi:peptide/nickel transport system permease protein
MTRFVLYTAAQMLVVMALASVLLFAMLHVLPGDPAQLIAGENAKPADVAAVRHQYGLDKPVVEQYFDWLEGLLHGDMGKSTLAQVPVVDRIRPTLIPTFELAVTSLLLALVVGIPLGTVAGARPRSIWDHGLTAFTAVALGVPGFAVGVLVLLFFAVQLKWLPPGGRVPLWDDPLEWGRHIVLPASTSALGSAAVIARFVRAGVQNSLLDDYGRTAKAKGLKYRTVVVRHALPNSLIPLITVVALQAGRLLGGAAITEQVFNWPGLGRLVVNAVAQRDYLVVQGALAIFVAAFVIANASADVMYAVADPRMRAK